MVLRSLEPSEIEPQQKVEARVPLWNTKRGYKTTGTAAPFQKNLTLYLQNHPDLEIYWGQDRDDSRPENWRMETQTGFLTRLVNGRVPLRNSETGKSLGGNSCPLFHNIESFIAKNPKYVREDGTTRRLPECKKRKKNNSLVPGNAKKYRKTGLSGDSPLDNTKTTAIASHADSAVLSSERSTTCITEPKKGPVDIDLHTLNLGHLDDRTNASNVLYGTGRYDNLFEALPTIRQEFPSDKESFDEYILL